MKLRILVPPSSDPIAEDGYAGTLPVPPAPEKPKSTGGPVNPVNLQGKLLEKDWKVVAECDNMDV